MTFTAKTWHDGPTGGTPISGAALSNLETRTSDAFAALPAIFASLGADNTFAGGATFTSATKSLRSTTSFGLGSGVGSPINPFFQNSVIDGSLSVGLGLPGFGDYVGAQADVTFQGGFANLITTVVGNISASSAVFAVTSGTLPAQLAAGWVVQIPGAGAAGGALKALVSSSTSSTITLQVTASTTVTGASAKISLVPDPGFLFGADDYIVTGHSAGDIAGITDMFGRVSEAHVNDPSATLAHVTGFQGQASLDVSGPTVSSWLVGVLGYTKVVAGATAQDVFSVYAQNPVVAGTVARPRAFFADGPAQFTGDTLDGTGAGSPSKGSYLGVNGSGSPGLLLSSGPSGNTFRISNSMEGHLNFELAGTAVLAQVDTAGGFAVTGRVNAGTGSSGTNTPNAQGAAKGAYLGRASNGSVGMELADGTNTFRVATGAGTNTMTFERAGNLVLGTFDGLGNLAVTASVSTALAVKVASYTLTTSDSIVLISGSGITITFPTPVGITGRRYTIKNKDASNTATLSTPAGNFDGGSGTATLSTSTAKTYISDGANWVSI